METALFVVPFANKPDFDETTVIVAPGASWGLVSDVSGSPTQVVYVTSTPAVLDTLRATYTEVELEEN